MMRHHQDVIFDLVEKPGGGEIRHDLFARCESVEAAVRGGDGVGQPGVPVEDVEDGQAVPAADLEIVEIVRRGDLDRAATRFPGRHTRRRRSE